MGSFYNGEVAVVVALLVVVIYWVQNGLRGRRLPPGPRPLPLIGNAHQMPHGYAVKTFAQWRDTYGDMIFVRIFNTPALIINSAMIAHDLLVKRGIKYADRAHSTLLIDLVGWENDFALWPYGKLFLKHRRWIYPLSSQDSLAGFMSIRQRESYILISRLFRDPERFDSHIRRFTASIMLETVYGYVVTSGEDEYVELMESMADASMSLATPGSAPVDFVPILKHLPAWLPGISFQRRALEARKVVETATSKMYAEALTVAVSGGAKLSIIPSLIKEYKEKGVLDAERAELMMFGAAIYAGGSDTSLPDLSSSFILTMVLNPDVFEKAQREMDQVVGSDRLPTVMDRESLPYLENILKEVLRWSCPVPLGLPHASSEDDVYGGYFIPKGTTVIANLWFMLHDPDIWPEPESFRPERFEGLTDQERERTDPRQVVFGYGQRICPGARFADLSIWFVMANMIATLKFGKARDASGSEITPPATFTYGMARYMRCLQ